MSADDLTALFALPPEEFVAARDELAKRRRAEGDREGAQEVRQLRRPTVPAWAVDQLARQHDDDLERLFEAGSALRLAQQQALSGRGAGLRAAAARRRELIDGLTGRAAQILTDTGRDPAPHRAAIAATLEAATLDDEAAAAVRAGTLAKELPAPAGFGDLTLVAEAPEEDAPEEEPPAASPDRDAELRQAREQADEADRAARDAERTAGDARREAEVAAQEVERLEDELAEARRGAQNTAKRARDALDAAERARGAANEAQDALRGAEVDAGK